MTIKLELTEERTQRELSEEEWAFPIWRWAALSLFDTPILVSPLTRELIYPGGSDSRFYLGRITPKHNSLYLHNTPLLV